MPAPSHHILTCSSIGSVASHLIQQALPIQSTGIASRGVFLKTGERWIIFLSLERFRGPLSLNLEGNPGPALERLQPGTPGELIPSGIRFPSVNLQIILDQEYIWQPSPPPTSQVSLNVRLAHLAHARRPGSGLGPLIPALFSPHPASQHPLAEAIFKIRSSLHRGTWSDIPGLAAPLLGYGPGLTPSGDDFLLGLLLAINRWGERLSLKEDVESLNTALTQAAYGKTTTLSANLIECAARGLADERLIHALDALVGSPADSDRVLDELLNWGNSSGLDALSGMLAVVLPLQKSGRGELVA